MNQTAGSQLLKLAQRTADKMSAVDAWKTKESDYLNELITCAETNRKIFDGDFFIVNALKEEKLFTKYLPWPVIHEYFIAQQSCPTPNYDQNVYKFNAKKEQIEYIWTIPDRQTCHYLYENKDIIDESERQLLKFVLDFADGTLFRLMKKLNGEEADSNKLEK